MQIVCKRACKCTNDYSKEEGREKDNKKKIKDKKHVVLRPKHTFQKWLIIFKCRIRLGKVQRATEQFHIYASNNMRKRPFMYAYTNIHGANTNQIKSNTW